MQTSLEGESKRHVLVFGGSGSLGQAMIRTFAAAAWTTISADFSPNADASLSLRLDAEISMKANVEQAKLQLADFFRAEKTAAESSPSPHASTAPLGLNACIVTSGGWCGGELAASNLFDCLDSMLDKNLRSAFAAAALFSHFARPASLLLFTGSYAAVSHHGTPEMLAYGASKAALHHLVLSLSTSTFASTNSSSVACILPITIDTPANRAVMKTANFEADWTPTSTIAEYALHWAHQALKRSRPLPVAVAASAAEHAANVATVSSHEHHAYPHLLNGAFYVFQTTGGRTTVNVVDEPLVVSSSTVLK